LLSQCFAAQAIRIADVAQLVEQRIRNAKVGGSTPLIGTSSEAAFGVHRRSGIP
jgi:hypothetical protein